MLRHQNLEMTQAKDIPALLKRRAQFYSNVRHFFAHRKVMEVQTPVLSHAAPTAPYLDSFSTSFQQGSQQPPLYLQTSPEFAMKRLLAAGSGPIFQICPVFRQGESGRLHSPEFTMLEWYRPGFSLADLMAEVDALLQLLLATVPAKQLTYQQAFNNALAVDVFTCDTKQLQQLALENIPSLPPDWHSDRDGWLELLMSEVIEPTFQDDESPVMVNEFPASQAQLAKTYQNNQGVNVAARFEVYAGGLELANGYDELLDADVLAARFARDNQQRQQQGLPVMPVDQQLLSAMQAGLPECSGVALGLDRLLMLISDCKNISDIEAIPFSDA
ncbi:MAG: EF-P lysine aminoacylase EpmA [Methylophaga sp.]|nr:EF-P lysine aminoacylase EpmA [Methylophaga sp.]